MEAGLFKKINYSYYNMRYLSMDRCAPCIEAEKIQVNEILEIGKESFSSNAGNIM